ncbi:MAG: NAD-dependent epimerase/dehydratase family protein, partial [Candidatus Dormibacterales bacterium]
LLEMDIRSPEAARVIIDRRPDAVCHHAAQMSVSRSVADPAFDASVNVMGSLNLLEAARRAGARFVFASTGGALYGDAAVLPTPETEPAWPLSPYGVGKLSVEHYLHFYGVEHGLPYVALRYANVYGPRQNPHGEAGVVAIFCRALFQGRPPVVNGDGTNTRDYVYVADVVDANLRALSASLSGHFNVGTGLQTDVNDLLAMIAGSAGLAADGRHGPPRPGEQRTSALDPALIAGALGWGPGVPLAEGIARTVDWFRGRA